MSIWIASAPCCWGVDNIKNPHLPPWEKVLDEAAQAGYSGIELGPYGYLSLDIDTTREALTARGLQVVAGTIFDDLVDPDNHARLIQQAHDICSFLKGLPELPRAEQQRYPAPYLVLIDHVHEARSLTAGHSDRAPRLDEHVWQQTMQQIGALADIAAEYGVRAVIHPHAGGYIEFEDEIERLLSDIPAERAGLCLDTGHLYYSGMDPLAWLQRYAARMDYLHFKDIDPVVYEHVMQEGIDFFDACAQGVMCPIGQGVIDYDAIRALLSRMDYQGYITIEQERDPRHVDGSLRDVMTSLDYLRKAGFHTEVAQSARTIS